MAKKVWLEKKQKNRHRKTYSEMTIEQRAKQRALVAVHMDKIKCVLVCVKMGFYAPSGWGICACGEEFPLFDIKNYTDKITCSIFTGKSCKVSHKNKTGRKRGQYRPRKIWSRKNCTRKEVQCNRYQKCLGWLGEFTPQCVSGAGFAFPDNRKYMEI